MRYMIVYNNGKYNFKNRRTNKLLFGYWFDYAEQYGYNFIYVKIKNKYNFLNNNGKFRFNTWLIDHTHMDFNLFRVKRRNGQYNIFNGNTNSFLFDEWIDYFNYHLRPYWINIFIKKIKYRINRKGNLMYCLD